MNEKEWAADFLDSYSAQLGGNICNDFVLEDTPKNRKLIKRYDAWVAKNNPIDPPVSSFQDGKIVTYDWLFAAYLRDYILDRL